MSQGQSLPSLKRVAAELGVIVLGVLIALSADRALMALDRAQEEEAYLEGLAQDLRSDSAQLATSARWADSTQARVRRLLPVVQSGVFEDPDHARLLYDLGVLSYFAPPEYTTDTWDEIIGGPGLGEISDRELRRTLTAYYNSADYWGVTEDFFLKRQSSFEEVASRTIPPLLWLYVYDRFAATYPTYALASNAPPRTPRTPSRDEVAAAIERFSSDSSAEAVLGYVLVDSRQQGDIYRRGLEECLQVLRLVEARLTGAS